MPRNGSGTYTIPNTFLPNTPILSSAMNANFSDVATALTGSLPRDGQAAMTGQLTAAAGTAAAPALRFTGSLTTGLFASTTNQLGFSTAGVERLRVKADGTLRGAADALLWAQLGAAADVQALLGAADYAAFRTLLSVLSSSATDAAIAAAVNTAVPVGSMMWWPKSTPPANWLERNGAAISRSTYATLFALIGTDYGSGNGSTTFNLPDDRGQFVRGWDDSAGVDPGRVFGSLQTDMVGPHDHPTYNFDYTVAGGGGLSRAMTTTRSGTTGNNSGTETRPKNRAYLPIIKAL